MINYNLARKCYYNKIILVNLDRGRQLKAIISNIWVYIWVKKQLSFYYLGRLAHLNRYTWINHINKIEILVKSANKKRIWFDQSTWISKKGNSPGVHRWLADSACWWLKSLTYYNRIIATIYCAYSRRTWKTLAPIAAHLLRNRSIFNINLWRVLNCDKSILGNLVVRSNYKSIVGFIICNKAARIYLSLNKVSGIYCKQLRGQAKKCVNFVYVRAIWCIL